MPRSTKARGRSQFGGLDRRLVKAKKVQADGITFDSGAEYNRYLELKWLEKAGEIRDLEVHTRTPLMCGDTPIKIRSKGVPNGRQCFYTDDFRYKERDGDGWVTVVEDVKGFDTPQARLRRAIFEAQTGILVRVIAA